MIYLWVALGSAAGGVTRFWAVEWAARRFEVAPVWGIVAVNVTGSFLIGLLFAWLIEGQAPGARAGSAISPLLLTGFCGGYTTFSAFSLQTLQLMRDHAWGAVAANVLLSVFGCLLAVWLGWVAGAALRR